ncbi:hypothetical protein, partial [Ruegeria hyattellae]|uniref:hypothetical protein n=1 Tax=Ruegeria hyattellae TaxID=3233337 RepID=UPI00355C1B92
RGIPCPVRTSTCRNFVTISSGFGRLFAIGFLHIPKHSGGPLQWGRTNIMFFDAGRGATLPLGADGGPR